MTSTSANPLNLHWLNCAGSPCLNARRLFLIFFLLLPAAVGLTGCGNGAAAKPAVARDDAIPVQVSKVELVEMDHTIPVVGTLAARSEALVAAQVEGQVEQTLVDFGNHVDKGQEIVLIDTASYAAVARQSAANLSKARANALNGEQSLHRIQQLITNRISSASELDSAVAAAQQGQAEVESAQAADVIAQLNLSRSRVKAPFNASVSERIVTAGDYVKVASPLYRIVDDTELKYLVQASEGYASKVKLGQLVQFTVDAWPGETFQGKVFLISPSVNTTTRAFNLGALVSNKEKKLKANMFARGELILEKNVPTPMVPLESIINFAGVTKVFTISGTAARSREVKLGRVMSGKQEILGGLSAGELVVTSGQTKLFEGAKVRLQETPAVQPSTGSSSAVAPTVSSSRSTALFSFPAALRRRDLALAGLLSQCPS